MRFAIVGCGFISRVHLAAMTGIADAEAVAVVDRDEQVARERAEEYQVPKTYTDWSEAFGSNDVDAALICLPHAMHYKCTTDALNAGKHVLIEKPIAVDVAQAREMTELARARNLTLMVAHMKRFDRRFQVMKAKIDEGTIGRPFLAKSEWIGPREVFVNNPWTKDAAGGGPLMGFGSHHIDLLHWMMGSVKRVSCYKNNIVWPDIEAEDSAAAIVEFENGAIGSITYTWGAEIYGQYENLAIYGTKGTLNMEQECLTLVSEEINGDRIPRPLDTTRSDSQDIEQYGKELAISSLEPFRLEIRHFIDSVKNGTAPITSGEVATEALETISRAHTSANGDGVPS